MGKSVLELTVETGKWDAGLRKAKSGLDNFIQANGGLSQALDKEGDKIRKFVQMMGGVESKSKTAKGQMNEYKSTLEQLTMQYNRMNDAQRKAVGQDYLQAIDSIKQKYQQVGEELKRFNKSLGSGGAANVPGASGGGGLFGGNKLSGAMQVFAGNMMTKGVMVAGQLASEIGDCVTQGIELARQGEGIRRAFERLDNPGLLQNLREATHGTVTDLELMKAAVKFNDFKLPVQELGTMLAFAQQKAKDTGQSVDYMVDSIVTGLGRKSLMILDNLGLSAAEIKEEMAKTGDMTTAVGEIIRKQMASAGEYVETAADRATKADVELKNAMEDLGRTFQPLAEAGSNVFNTIKIGALNLLNSAIKPLIQALSEAGALGKGAQASAGYNNQGGNAKVDRMISKLGTGKSAGAYSIYTQQLGEFDKYINNKRFQIAAYGGDNSSVAQSAKQKLQTQLDGALKMRAEYVKRAKALHDSVPSPLDPTPATTTGGKTTGGKTGGTSVAKEQTELQANQTRINELTQEYVRLGDLATQSAIERKAAIQGEIRNLENRNNTLKLYAEQAQGKLLGGNINAPKAGTVGIAIPTTDVEKMVKNIQDEVSKHPIVVTVTSSETNVADVGKETADVWRNAAASISAAGQAMNAIEDPSARIAGIVMQAIATTALAYSQALATDWSSKSSIWSFIAAAAANTASMVATISSIHSATGYSEGGVVQGNTYSNDQIPSMLNAGEVVLTRAMAGNLASQLNSNGNVGHLVGRLRGRDILISVERTLATQGKGELATFK